MPSPRINVKNLKAFVAVYEEQSFSRAAIREGATQSGMSTQVRSLENALKTTLLVRQTGRLELTPAGDILYDQAHQILRSLFDLEERISGLDGAITGRIRLGIIPGLTRAVLPKALPTYRQNYPNVEVSILEEYSYSLMRRVLEGDLDCALVPAGDVLTGLASTHMGSDQEVLLAGRGQLPDVPHLSAVGPHALTGLELIVPSQRNVRRRWLNSYMDMHGVRPGGLLEMDAMLATLEFVASTEWSAVLPSVVCHPDLDGRLRKLHPLEGPAVKTDYIAVRKLELAESRALSLLIAQLRHDIDAILADWAQARAGSVPC